MRQDAIRAIFRAAGAAQQQFVARHVEALARVIDVTVDALAAGRTLLFFGNGSLGRSA